MSTELALANSQLSAQKTPAEVRQHVGLIQNVMRDVMKSDTHYGKIPGCDKPTLYKAGSEVLLTTFMIGTRVEVEDLSSDDCFRYRVKVIGFHQPTGRILGEGVGECSTDETKYKWKRTYIKEEFDDTPEGRRKFHYSKSKNGPTYKNMMIRTEPADLANTVLKMAKKRAQIDFTLTALGASDIFTQDIEDLPPDVAKAVDGGKKGDDQPDGDPISHPDLDAATNIQELTKAMNSIPKEDKAKYIPYYNKRREDLANAGN
jgi:hypothetical protein